MRVPAKFPIGSGAENGRDEADAAQESTEARAEEAGSVVTEAMVAPLSEALRGLLAEGLPAEEIEEALGRLLVRLRAGVEHLRPNKQLAPWMHGVVCRVVEEATPTGPRPASLTVNDPAGQDWIAGALLPFLDLVDPEHADVLQLTDHGALTQRAAAGRLGIPLVTLKSQIQVARRRLRVVVLAGLALLAPDLTETPEPADPNPDTRAPRRRLPASSLLPAFTAGLEQLARPWVPEEHASASAVAILARLRTAIDHLPNNGHTATWIYTVARETIFGAPWDSSTLPALTATYPDRPSTEARATLASAIRALLDGALTDQARALVLVDLKGHTQREAAKLEAILPETFKQRLWRARRHCWSTLHSALASSRKPEPSTPAIDMLIDSLQSLAHHLATTTTPAPVVQKVLRQLHQHAREQRPSSSLVEHLYALTVAALQPRATSRLAAPPAQPGPAERAALAACLAPLLATLTPDQAEALNLFDLENLSLNAAAAQVGTARPAFQGRLQRARARICLLLREAVRSGTRV